MSTIEFNERVLGMESNLQYFALSLTRNSDDAKDLVQDSLLKALRYRDKFSDGTNFKAWIHTIMKNTFINRYRRVARGRHVIQQLKSDQTVWFEHTASPDAISQLSEGDIRGHIGRLAEDFKIPFTMFCEGYKYSDIATEMNIPIGTVKSRIFQARKRLARDLTALA